jgi:hypothetical protein
MRRKKKGSMQKQAAYISYSIKKMGWALKISCGLEVVDKFRQKVGEDNVGS